MEPADIITCTLTALVKAGASKQVIAASTAAIFRIEQNAVKSKLVQKGSGSSNGVSSHQPDAELSPLSHSNEIDDLLDSRVTSPTSDYYIGEPMMDSACQTIVDVEASASECESPEGIFRKDLHRSSGNVTRRTRDEASCATDYYIGEFLVDSSCQTDTVASSSSGAIASSFSQVATTVTSTSTQTGQAHLFEQIRSVEMQTEDLDASVLPNDDGIDWLAHLTILQSRFWDSHRCLEDQLRSRSFHLKMQGQALCENMQHL